MNAPRQRINFLQILIGTLVLLLGTLVYLVDRPHHETYFVSNSRVDIRFFQQLPNLFGAAGNHLPAFAHVFAFTMITASLLACGKKGYLLSAAGWLITDSLFEIGQKYGTEIGPFIPGWFDGIPFLESAGAFFANGTFDWNDLMAIVVGAVSAYVVLLITRKRMIEA